MKRMALCGIVGGMLIGHGAMAQNDSAATPTPPTPTQSTQKAAPSATPNTTGAPKTKQVKPAEKQKAYTGNTGKKRDPGTACNSARPTANGGIDCGMKGDAAKVPK